MPSTAQEVFANNVCLLPPAERLRLAALILDDLTQAKPPRIDHSDTWSEQDRSDLTAFSLRYAATLYPEEGEEIV